MIDLGAVRKRNAEPNTRYSILYARNDRNDLLAYVDEQQALLDEAQKIVTACLDELSALRELLRVIQPTSTIITKGHRGDWWKRRDAALERLP